MGSTSPSAQGRQDAMVFNRIVRWGPLCFSISSSASLVVPRARVRAVTRGALGSTQDPPL